MISNRRNQLPLTLVSPVCGVSKRLLLLIKTILFICWQWRHKETTIYWICSIRLQNKNQRSFFKSFFLKDFRLLQGRSTYNKLEMSWAGQPSKFVHSVQTCDITFENCKTCSELGKKKTGIHCQNAVQAKNKHKCYIGKMLTGECVLGECVLVEFVLGE